MIGRALAVVAVCVSCGPSHSGNGSRGHSGDEVEEIHKVVFEAQRAGFLRRDLAKYMAQWTDDAKIVAGRSEAPGEYDWTLSREQIEATRALQFQEPSVARAVEFENPRVTFEGDVAILRVDTQTSYPDAFDRAGEIYKLRKTEQGWRVFENRWWMVASMAYGDVTEFDEAFWAGVDAHVDAERAAGETYEYGFALMAAWRFPEAHAVFVKLTEGEDAEPHDWALRAQAALMIGHADDALKSFRAVLELDPRAQVPIYAR